MFQSKLIRVMFYCFLIMGALEIIGFIISIPFLWDYLYPDFVFFYYIFIPHGILFFLLGLIPIIINSKKQKAMSLLRKEGNRVEARITELRLNKSVTVNMKNPYIIICKVGHGNMREYKSEDILGEPDYNLIGKPITVFISKTDPKKYLVDISEFL